MSSDWVQVDGSNNRHAEIIAACKQAMMSEAQWGELGMRFSVVAIGTRRSVSSVLSANLEVRLRVMPRPAANQPKWMVEVLVCSDGTLRKPHQLIIPIIMERFRAFQGALAGIAPQQAAVLKIRNLSQERILGMSLVAVEQLNYLLINGPGSQKVWL
jgi:hypothetical protein